MSAKEPAPFRLVPDRSAAQQGSASSAPRLPAENGSPDADQSRAATRIALRGKSFSPAPEPQPELYRTAPQAPRNGSACLVGMALAPSDADAARSRAFLTSRGSKKGL